MHTTSKAIVLLTLLADITLASLSETSSIDALDVFERLSEVPRGWKQGVRALPDFPLKFNLVLAQPRAAEFEQFIFDSSHPDHPIYGKRLSREGIEDFLRPEPKAVRTVVPWLSSQNVSQRAIVQKGDWLSFTATVSQAERMFDTEYHYYTYKDKSIVRTLQYSVPAHLHSLIDLIQPTTRFSNIKSQTDFFVETQQDPSTPAFADYDTVKCNTSIIPSCLRGLYQIHNFSANAFVGNKLGISGYLEEYVRHSDLHHFISQFAPYAKNTNLTVEMVNGGENLQNSSVQSSEASVDIQYGSSLSADTHVTYYTTGGRGRLIPDLDQPRQKDNQNEPYLEQLQYLLSLPDNDLPSVLSTSYGEDEQSVPASYAKVVCNLFARLGARGVSVIFSSGDTGVGSACQTNDGLNITRFLPIFPASCPFVTSVGGTFNVEPERAASFSSGGFSDLFPRPGYQEKAVCGYLNQLGARWKGLYNPQGRGYPDVAAQSVNFYIYDHNSTSRISGTSCAAPVFAAIVANLNSIRMTLGLPSLGFLNPFLYSYGYDGLTDIVLGGSTGCAGYDQFSFLRTPVVPYASWNATEGWDPVTGLGTPVFPKLVDLMFQHAVPNKSSHQNSEH